ncbi:MAG: glycosyltransferase family 4 protein [Desulfocapsaceae bacterium]|nr:glycosyltransferase family 4 protein [Desulfocapsaceae bacterium]
MTSGKKLPRVDIWHNILWSKYKGEVFSAVHKLNNKDEFDIRFIQIAETAGNRVDLAGIDLAHHRYPFDLIFKGSLDNVSLIRRTTMLILRILKSDADMILLTGYEKIEYWVQLFLIKLKGKKAALFCDSTIHDNKQTFFKDLLKRVIFTSVDGIFGYGSRSKEYVVHFGVDPKKVYTRCQAAALPLDYCPNQALADRLAKAGKPDAPRYLYIGRLSPEKGLDTLLHAYAQVKAQKPSASLIIVGDGPEREILEGLALQLNLGDAVRFVGSKRGTDLFQEYSRATCFVLPSRSEPWGLVINEALSYGCPVIVSERCGCIPELVIEGKTGFMHKVDDVHDLTAKMLATPEHFSDIQQSARICIDHIKNFSPDAAAAQILYGIKTILSKK